MVVFEISVGQFYGLQWFFDFHKKVQLEIRTPYIDLVDMTHLVIENYSPINYRQIFNAPKVGQIFAVPLNLRICPQRQIVAHFPIKFLIVIGDHRLIAANEHCLDILEDRVWYLTQDLILRADKTEIIPDEATGICLMLPSAYLLQSQTFNPEAKHVYLFRVTEIEYPEVITE